MKGIVSVNPPRNYKNIGSLNKTAQYITAKLRGLGYEALEQKYSAEGYEFKNIHAFYNDPNLPRLVIGAHYDVYGESEGADDNASGVVGLLMLAELFMKYKPNLAYSIEFVFYTLEEPPFFRSDLMGSYIHARSLKAGSADVIGMVSVEMIGFFTDKEDSQNYPLALMKLFYPDKGDFIAVVSNLGSGKLKRHFKRSFENQHIKVESLSAPSFLVGIDFSDHLNYWKFDYPAIMVTDTSFYRNKNYHTGGDTMDTVNFEKLVEVVKGLYVAAANMELK